MGKMADALNWFRVAMAKAHADNERDELREELCDNDMAIGDLHWQIQRTEKRNREILARLKELDGPAVVTPSASVTPIKPPLAELPPGFTERHPALAEGMRLNAFAEPLLPFGRNEVRPQRAGGVK